MVTRETEIKELEPFPRVQVTFRGHNHSDFNLQGVDGIVTDFRQFLVNAPGRKMLYLEFPNLRQARRKNYEEYIRQNGLFKSLLAGYLLHKQGVPCLLLRE